MTAPYPIILRRGDPSKGFVLLRMCEPAVDTVTGIIKFGDGVREWNDLPAAGTLPDYALKWYRERTPW